MDPVENREFFKAQDLNLLARASAPAVSQEISKKKKKCGCKKGITVLDVVTAALAAYGLWKLGFTTYEMIHGLFQKGEDPK